MHSSAGRLDFRIQLARQASKSAEMKLTALLIDVPHNLQGACLGSPLSIRPKTCKMRREGTDRLSLRRASMPRPSPWTAWSLNRNASNRLKLTPGLGSPIGRSNRFARHVAERAAQVSSARQPSRQQ